ncbi:MAG: Xaa-Pro peptidase family protein [Oscillospiraceae bacterium]|nr:Xaa-Pro peptidase family protein [Oscillospiraceae bacterium]
MKLQRLIDIIPAELDGVLITSEANFAYFTGFRCDSGLLLASRAGSVFFTDSRYLEAARKRIVCCDVMDMAKLPELLKERCEAFLVKRLGAESRDMTMARKEKYESMLDGVGLVFGDMADSLIDSLRRVKDSEEVKLIKAAQAVTEKAFDHILGFIKEGMTEREIRLELDFYMLKNGAGEVAFKTIAVSGENSSLPHGVPSHRRIRAGDMLTLDFGASLDGYNSDMTRTVAVKCFSKEQRRVYDTVLSAQTAALNTLRAGAVCKDCDAAARNFIAGAGYGEYFGHGTGHGVGLLVHEYPLLSPKSDEILEVGNVVTVEPGIYMPGRFGVRIEDMALVTEDGYENLTGCTKELLVVG